MRKDSKDKHDTLVEYAIQTNSNTKDNSLNTIDNFIPMAKKLI